MLVSNLYIFVKSAISYYKKSNIFSVIQEAKNISLKKHTPSYEGERNAFLQKLNNIIKMSSDIDDITVVNNIIEKSRYIRVIPNQIAEDLKKMLSRNKENVAPLEDFDMIFEKAKLFYQELDESEDLIEKLNKDEIYTCNKSVPVEIKIPRENLEDNFSQMLYINKNISDMIIDVSEMINNKRSPAKLVSSSTSDLITTICHDISVILPFLDLCDKILGISLKFAKMYSQIQQIRNNANGVITTEADTSLKELRHAEISSAIDLILNEIENGCSEERKNELRNAIGIKAKKLSDAFSVGVNVSLSETVKITGYETESTVNELRTIKELGKSIKNNGVQIENEIKNDGCILQIFHENDAEESSKK